jgi:alpha-glucosidase
MHTARFRVLAPRPLPAAVAAAVALAALLLPAPVRAVAPVAVCSSPDGRLVWSLHDETGGPTYEVRRGDRTVLERSALGFELRDAAPLGPGLRAAGVRERDGVEEWEQPWGERRFVSDAYHETEVDLAETEAPGRALTLTVRAFDDGIAFRFTWPEQEHLGDFAILDERTEFRLPGDPVAWWIPAYAGNRYEYLYSGSRLSALAARTDVAAIHTPATFELENGLVVSIHEAALTDYASMTVRVLPGSRLTCDLVPWADGDRVKAHTPFRSPWRTIQVAEHAGDLLASTMILSLNEPSRIEDTSWIRPMKYAGIWWSLHIGKETWKTGPTHGATTANAKRMIDFAADNGLGGVLVEGWNTGWDLGWLTAEAFDWTTPAPDYDLEAVARYAQERNVTLIGHLETGGDVRGFERRMEAAFAQCERLGIHAAKTGYVSHGQSIRRYDADGKVIAREWQHGQYMVRQYRKAVETAARHHVMLDVHEPIKDTGIRRTWPNLMTREGARGQEYNAWSEGNPPDHTTILPFTRLLGGPMDFTPGIFDVRIGQRPDYRVHTTVAKQLAPYVVIYSPLQMVTDLPENYAGRPAFGFLLDVPCDWEETRVLNGAIGDYVTIARRERGGPDWYLGAVTDEEPRALSVPLRFLGGGEWIATIYEDAPGADWQENPMPVRITRRHVTGRETLELALAPGGGTAIRFRPAP